jgi:hypothetical protein
MVNQRAGTNPMERVVEDQLSGIGRKLVRISSDVVFHRDVLRSGEPRATADQVHAALNANGASRGGQLSLELDDEE